MLRFRTFSRRLFLTVLFCGAWLTTIQVITGLTTNEIGKLLHQEVQSVGKLSDHVNDNLKLKMAVAPKYLPNRGITTKDQSVKTIELVESKNLKSYPSKVVLATGYTAGKESTGKTPGEPTYGITYSGVEVTRDVFSTIAADPSVFPIGSILYIPGYGYGVVADTGSAIKGNKIDLYFKTVTDVYKQWGKKKIRVYVLKQGKGTLSQETMKRLNSHDSLQVYDNEELGKAT